MFSFLNREDELARLNGLLRVDEGGFAVVYGRRRIGKTRLLLEWCERAGGIYTVADQSSPDVQRKYFAESLAQRFPGFADVEYPEWRALFARLASEAKVAKWRGPLVLDELPYLVASSPELPSVLQRWIDHDARQAGLAVAIAGSSQRMMQGLALDRGAPLYGRARELFEVLPLAIEHVARVLRGASARDTLDFYTAWGGVPRYWELATSEPGDSVAASIERHVLAPGGVLHHEPDRLLLEEIPSAMEVRPVLDALGAGAHRVSEIAARLGRPSTSLSRPLDRLMELGLATREIPFGESPRSSKKSLYRIADPFTRLWFRAVAPHRAELVSGTRKSRLAVLARYWDQLAGATWESLCRALVPSLAHDTLGDAGDWKPASRWWSGNAPEWDIVAEDVAGKRLLLGEVKLAASPDALPAHAAALASRPPPVLGAKYARHHPVRALFVPETPRATHLRAVSRVAPDVAIVSLRDLAGVA